MHTAIKSADDWTLGDLALDLLTGNHNFTDFHVETDKPAMIRRSSGDWTEVLNGDGNPIVVDHPRIIAFLDGVFADESAGPNAKLAWKVKLHQSDSLHPAINLYRNNADATKVEGCRVRCTVQKQMMGESIGLVMRPLRMIPKDLQSLGLPVQVSTLLRSATNGLIVVTGPTGSGKSTTLAAMVNEINTSKRANILTIEDPVEFIHERVKSIINQRELGIDVATYEAGVKDALRFVPDVILIGEIRDAQTMRAALRAAESGHLVVTTTHAPNSASAIRKMVSYLESGQADTQALSATLVGVIAQALVRDVSEQGKNHLAYEVLNCRDPKVIDAILNSSSDAGSKKMSELETAIRSNQMETSPVPMISSLKELVKRGLVDPRVAASVVVSASDKSELLQMKPEGRSTSSVTAIATPASPANKPVSSGWTMPSLVKRNG